MGEKIVLLKNKPDMFFAEGGQTVIRE